MELLGISWALASLVGAAGVGKLIDPRHTSGALRALKLPSHWVLVRGLGLFEFSVAVAVVLVGGVAPTLVMAALYAGFALFVVAALRAETPLSSCGCFGRPDTPPGTTHLAVNVAAAALLGLQAAFGGTIGFFTAGISALPVILAGLVLGYLLFALMSVRPASLV